MPEEGGAQAPALRNRVNSGQRQKPVVGRRMELGHLLDHGMQVAEDLIAAAVGDQLPERCFIRPESTSRAPEVIHSRVVDLGTAGPCLGA